HLTNWIGGMGIIVLSVAILPLLGVGGMQLFKAETPGPMKDTKLTPRIASTAQALWFVYGSIARRLGVGRMQLFKAETPGPMKDTKLTPRIASTAKALWFVYVAITVVCILSLRLAGMNWFDAFCHAFAVMALGGFSTHDASIAHYDSVPVEI